MATISTHNGSKAHRDHNIRNPKVVAKEKHIDPNGEYEIWHDEKPRNAYKRLFGEALADYNATVRADRQIKDYYAHICKDAKKHPVYEMIVGVYDPVYIDPNTRKSILREFVDGWQNRNPNLELIGAYYHADEEGGAHVHIDYVPVATGYKKGMAVQTALVKALEQQGFWTSSRKLTAQIRWESAENRTLEDICKKHGISVEHPDIEKREHLRTDIYKLQQEVGRMEDAFARVEDESIVMLQSLEKLEDEHENLSERSKMLKNEISELKAEISTLKEQRAEFEDLAKESRVRVDALNEMAEREYQKGEVKGMSRESMTVYADKKVRESRIDKFLEIMGLKEMCEKYVKNPNSLYREARRILKEQERD